MIHLTYRTHILEFMVNMNLSTALLLVDSVVW